MTDITNTRDMAADGFDGHSVIAVSFEDDRNAYEALTCSRSSTPSTASRVREAVVVVRGEDGQVVAKDRVESPPCRPRPAAA